MTEAGCRTLDQSHRSLNDYWNGGQLYSSEPSQVQANDLRMFPTVPRFFYGQ